MPFRGSSRLAKLVAFRQEKPETRRVRKEELAIRFAKMEDISIRSAKHNEELGEIAALWKSARGEKGSAQYKQRQSAWFSSAVKLGYFNKEDGKWRYVG